MHFALGQKLTELFNFVVVDLFQIYYKDVFLYVWLFDLILLKFAQNLKKVMN